MSHLIETGTRLELRKRIHVEAENEVCYISRFLYQKSVDEAVIEMPTKNGVLIPLEPEDTFLTCFYTSKGLYRCQSQVVSRHYEDSLPVAVIRFRSEFEKLQRRQFYRMESVLQLTFCVVEEAGLEQLLHRKYEKLNAEAAAAEENGEAVSYQGVTLDISGGGVRFNSEYKAQCGEILAMRISFLSPVSRELQILFARVLTVTPVPMRSGVFEHRAEFVSITNTERESLIRYIFLEERKRRKKETEIE